MDLVELKDVYKVKQALRILYRLLAERPKLVNISHRKMPSFYQHRAFVKSRPYKAWYLIEASSQGFVGGVYLSKSDEIGVFVFKEYRRKGYGQKAVNLLMNRHRGVRRFLANISPKNGRSIQFFKGLKFWHIQNTYEFRRQERKGGGHERRN